MKISKNCAQFDTHRSLFVVTGSVEADFYVAYQGEINKVKTFTISNPAYSGRKNPGKSGVSVRAMVTGEKNESIKANMRAEFLIQIKNILKEFAKEQFDHLYIFCPAIVHNEIENVLPTTLKKKLVRIWKGNYHQEKPIALLEKIKKIQ